MLFYYLKSSFPYNFSNLFVKDSMIIREAPIIRPNSKRIKILRIAIEKGIKNIFTNIRSFTVLKTLDFIEYLLIQRLYRILL